MERRTLRETGTPPDEQAASWMDILCSRLESDARRGTAGDRNWFALWPGTLMPGHHGVLAVRNVVDFEASSGVGLRVIGGGTDDDVSRHFGMHITEQRDNARLVELEGTFFALGPGAEIVGVLLVSADGRPKHIVLYGVVVLEINRRARLNYENRGVELQSFLVDKRLLRRCGKCPACDCVDIHHRIARRRFAFDSSSGSVERRHQQKRQQE